MRQAGLERIEVQHTEYKVNGFSDCSSSSMRHSTAVHLLRAGVDIFTISQWLGHASVTFDPPPQGIVDQALGHA
jgi:site-specific recombinase XerD